MSFSSEALARTPRGYYRLGESSGTTMVDSSGNGHNGTYDSGLTFGATGALVGDADTAIGFSGTRDGTVPNSSGLFTGITSAISLGAWFKTTDTGVNTIAGRWGISTGQTIAIDLQTSNVIRVYMRIGGATRIASATITGLRDGNWHNVFGTYDGANVKLYVDKVLRATLATTGVVDVSVARDFTIGTRDESNGFTGTLDEVLLYATALSLADIEALYDAGMGTAAASVSLAGTVQAATAAFSVATVLAASLAGTVQPSTASFDLSASAQVSLAGTTQAPTGSFDVASVADQISISLAGVAQSPTAAFGVLTASDASLAGEVQPSVGAFSLSASAQVALAGTAQSATGAFDVETISVADRLVSLAGSARRTTAAITIASQPAVRIAGTVRASTGAFAIDAQPTVTLVGTVQPSLATFVTYVVTPVEPSPVVGAQAVVVARAFGPVTMQGSQAVYTVSSAYTPKARQRILVDNIDVTYFRDGVTPDIPYTLVEPLLYGPATLTIPQVAACFERIGQGELSFLRPGAAVEVQRVLDDVVVGTDYKGLVIAWDLGGRNLSVELGGYGQGRAALRNRQSPIFARINDIGRQIADAITDLGLPHYPHLGATTGLEAMTMGGTGHLEHIQALVAKAWTRSGRQWTVMPDESTGVYETHRKDDTTIHGTVFIDDAKTVANLRRDIAEEPNRIYITGVLLSGQRVRFGVYPGLIQGPVPDFMGPIEEGDAGEAVRLLVGKLHATGYLKLIETEGGFDADVTEAVIDLQNDAGLFDEGFDTPAVPGVVGIRTWEALYDLGVTGTSLEWAHIEPAAQRRKVRRHNRSAQGGIMSENPLWEPGHLVRDRNVDAGGGWKNRSQLREFSWAILDDSDAPNWVGDITFHTGALIRGDGFEGMTVTAEDVMDARELRPGMNLDLPQFDGGTFFHIAAIQVDDSGIVTATVDTRFRDAMEVWEVIARNKESRNDPARTRNQKHRSSTIAKDTIGEWDEIGGLLGQDFDLKPGWNEFEVVAAMEGTISRIRIVLDNPAEFACAVFERQRQADWLNTHVPKPLTNFGGQKWDQYADELEDRGLLVAFGTKDEPCGYSPGRKQVRVYNEGTDQETSTTTNDPTGKFVDDGGFRYASANRTELTIAVWVAEENMIPLGRILRPQLESAV